MLSKNCSPEETDTHKSAKTHAGTAFVCLVTITLDLLTPKLMGF